MDIESLRILIDASQTLNFSETARRIHVSQSTVSKHILNLEIQLNVTIFDRNGPRLQLTEAGKATIPLAKKLVNECEQFQQMVSTINEDVIGPLQIACSTATGKYVLPMLAVRFRERFPSVDISMLACQPDDVESFLKDDQVDLAVVSFEIPNPNLECQVFFYDQIIMIAPPDHPLTLLSDIQPDDIVRLDMLLREPTSGTRRTLLSALAAHDISSKDLNIILELGNAEAIVSTVALGIGIAFVSRASANFALKAGDVVKVEIPMFSLNRKICMLRKKMGLSSRVADVFWSFIHEPENVELIKSIVETQ